MRPDREALQKPALRAVRRQQDDLQSSSSGFHPGEPASVEIFLSECGLARPVLHRAIQEASRLDMGVDEVLIKSGLITEHEFYNHLATWLGVRFSPRVRVLPLPGNASADDLSRCAHAGFCRLQSGTGEAAGAIFVLAPFGESLKRIITFDLAGRGDLVMTTPAALLASLRLSNSQWIAQEAAGFGLRNQIRYSAYQGLSLGQVAMLGVCAAVIPFSAIIDPEDTISLLAILAGPVFIMLIVFRLGASLANGHVDDDVQPAHILDADLPVYTVIIPLFRERRILPRLLAAIARLDYPHPKLDVKIVVEIDDLETRNYLHHHVLPAYIDVIVVPKGKPRTKPRALNAALLEARGSLLTIYDAEDVPDPQQLRLAAACFATSTPETMCLQAHLTIDNLADSWLSRFFALEYAALFEVINPGLLKAGFPILLGGTSNHFRTEALVKMGGWDAWNVTEDADLSFRMAKSGYRTAELNSRTLEESPTTFGIWLRQRTRWMKGYMQTLVVHARNPAKLVREAGIGDAATLFALTFGTVISALGYPFFMAGLVLSAANGSLLAAKAAPDTLLSYGALGLFGSGLVSMIVPAILGARRLKMHSLLVMVPGLPFYYLLVSMAAWRGLCELITNPHYWNKTDHGLARTSHFGPDPVPD